VAGITHHKSTVTSPAKRPTAHTAEYCPRNTYAPLVGGASATSSWVAKKLPQVMAECIGRKCVPQDPNFRVHLILQSAVANPGRAPTASDDLCLPDTIRKPALNKRRYCAHDSHSVFQYVVINILRG